MLIKFVVMFVSNHTGAFYEILTIKFLALLDLINS